VRIEQTIISNLITSEEYSRKIIPHLKKEYFADRKESIISSIIMKFFDTYNKPASKEIINIELGNTKGISDKELSEMTDYVKELSDEPANQEWLVVETEKFCKNRAVYNAILQSIKIIDGTDKQYTQDALPSILSDALAVSFDNSVGHDYIDDAESRFEFYHKKEDRIPFDLDMFNKITNGGLPRKTLNIALAGCVHPDTNVIIRYKKDKVVQTEKQLSIKEIDNLLKEGYEVQVDSPDGYVPVNFYVDKGMWEEYVLQLDNGTTVRVNENHLFETTFGWEYAKDLLHMGKINYLTKNGYVKGEVFKTGQMIPIVDINVEHDNHRYYTNGVSSHNTGVGKSLFMCHVASGALSHGRNVLYITMEMAEERIAERIDANILNLSMDELKTIERDSFNKRIAKVAKKTQGKLIVKEYPTASAHAGHFRALLEELKIKRGFTPDIIMIDYLNICASQRMKQGGSVNSYTYVKSIAEELRGLAVEYNVPIISATQTTRGGYSNSDVGLEDTSESFGLPATADLMFALISNEELEQMNQIIVKQLKNRYNDPSYFKRFVLGIDRSKMKLYDVEASAQTNLADSGQPKDDTPLFDKSAFGKRARQEGSYNDFKF
jgi:replicative DNA helicase